MSKPSADLACRWTARGGPADALRSASSGRPHVFGLFGGGGQIRQPYREGQEDQLAALGLVVNAVALWNTRYLSAGVDQLRAQGVPVKDEDVTRLSPLGHVHINFYLDTLQNRYGPWDQRFPEPTRFWSLLAVIGPLPADGNEELPGDGLLSHGLLLNAGLRRP